MGVITVIGSMNIDLVVRTPRAPLPGETISGTDFHLIPGGKGANQAVAAAQTGATTKMVGCTGSDAFARVILNSLIECGVDVSGVECLENVPTGTATILVEDTGQNRIVVVPGANGMVSPAIIDAKWPSIRASEVILLQYEIPLETVHYILKRASREKIRVVLNPAPIYPIPTALLAMIDILILNEGEATELTGSQVTDELSARNAAQKLVSQGVRTAIITLGSQGAVLHSSQETLFQPAFKVDVVDTTAAGDTFTGVYAACIVNGKQPSEALRFAAAASALSVTRLGAQTSIPSWSEVEDYLDGLNLISERSVVYVTKGGDRKE